MIECRNASRVFEATASGEALPDRLGAHAAHCPACQASVRRAAQFDAELRDAARALASPHLPDMRDTMPVDRNSHGQRFLAAAATVAAAAAVALLLVAVLRPPSPQVASSPSPSPSTSAHATADPTASSTSSPTPAPAQLPSASALTVDFPDARCLDFPEEVCAEAMDLAAPYLADEEPTTPREVVVGLAGGAAECVPGPCPEMVGVAAYYPSGMEVTVILERQEGGLVVTETNRRGG